MPNCAKIWGYLDDKEFRAWEFFYKYVMCQNQHLKSVECHLYCSDESKPYYIKGKRSKTDPMDISVSWHQTPCYSLIGFHIVQLEGEDVQVYDDGKKIDIDVRFDKDMYISHIMEKRNVFRHFRSPITDHQVWQIKSRYPAYARNESTMAFIMKRM